MKRLLKVLLAILLAIVIASGLAFGGAYGYVRMRMAKDQTSYTTTVENIIVEQVPDSGIVVNGRTYDAYGVYNFLEEIRYDPYNYVHKDHHCILQYVPQEQIYVIVNTLRIVMGCK